MSDSVATDNVRVLALSQHLEVEPDLIEPSSYDEQLLIVNRHRVKRGTSPDEAQRLVNQLRDALQLAVEHARKRGITLVSGLLRGRGLDFFDYQNTPTLVMPERVALWHTWQLRHAAVMNKAKHAPLHQGDMLATYGNLISLLKACHESEVMLGLGLHDVVNTLFFLTQPQGDPHAVAHRLTLTEAFDKGSYRDHQCIDCGFTWTDRVTLSAHTNALSGEPFPQCPSCWSRACSSSPIRTVTVLDRRTSEWTNDGEYLVVDDDEANDLWDAALESYLDECVEGADSPYFDREKWKKDARIDGRAHSVGRYDGCEHVVTTAEGETLFIYRQN